MLFDLRSRGRRRTVQVIYIGLAVLIGAGLILFGVGTGGSGGLFSGLDSNGSSNAAGSANSKAIKTALAQTKQSPSDATAWANLAQARSTAANATFDNTTETYTTAGKQQLTLLIQAWEHYSKLTSTPSASTQTIAARAYSVLGQYANSATLYQTATGAQSSIYDLECVALESYAAGNDRVAGLAQSRVLSKIAKSGRASVKAKLEAAKTTPSAAAQSC